MEEKLLKIINHYGIMPQLKYIHSEYFELDEVIINTEDCKAFDESEGVGYNEKICKKYITEELEDVMVMLKQFQYYYGIDDKDIETIMQQKIERQLKRIEVENVKSNN